jgi:hypothetical protein
LGGRRVAKYVRYSEVLGEEICARVRAGESLASVCRGPSMPNATSAYAWAEAWPVFGAALR